MQVLIIGDIIIDRYIHGTTTRLNPEAPVPVVNVTKEYDTYGGASLVFKNLESLGVHVTQLHYDDEKSIKTRVLSDNHYITRIDQDTIANGDDIANDVEDLDLSNFDYVILSDYNKGVLDNVQRIIKHCNKFNCKVIVDPKRHADYYKGAWLVKPNSKEFKELGFDKWDGNIIITNGGNTCTAELDNIRYVSKPDKVEVSDVTGAGDCFLAGLVYGLTNEMSFQEALDVAVSCSTESVKHHGTYVLMPKDVRKKTVFTNGCFDVLHTGHLTLLKEAKAQGDYLIVGLNSDESIQQLKGNNRPFNNYAIRRQQLELIPYVDEIIEFSEPTPIELIKDLQPNLIVKGGDYKIEDVVGHDIAPVYIVPTVEGHSTTNILKAQDENTNNRT